MIEKQVKNLIAQHTDHHGDIDIPALSEALASFIQTETITLSNNESTASEEAYAHCLAKFPQTIDEQFLRFERLLYLQSIDELWMQHIDAMSGLKEEVVFE